MKLKRTHTIKALLLIYIGLSAAVCIALPSHLSEVDNDPGTASLSSAPLDLPQDVQQRIEEDLGTGDNKPEPVSEPEAVTEPEPELPQTPEETEPEPETPTETNQEPETETPTETDQEPEAETPTENTAYVSTKNAGASVNLRAAANSGSKIIANVYDKDEVTVLSVSGKWYEIQAGDVRGYIYQDYLVLADE